MTGRLTSKLVSSTPRKRRPPASSRPTDDMSYTEILDDVRCSNLAHLRFTNTRIPGLWVVREDTDPSSGLSAGPKPHNASVLGGAERQEIQNGISLTYGVGLG